MGDIFVYFNFSLVLWFERELGKFIYFPTKDDWKNESKIEYIEAGLDSLCRCLEAFPNLKLAIPPIGCGLGGLKIENVLPVIYEKTMKHRNHIMYLVGF